MTVCIYFFNEFTKHRESNFSNYKLICQIFTWLEDYGSYEFKKQQQQGEATKYRIHSLS